MFSMLQILSNDAMQLSTLTRHFHSKQERTKRVGELGDGPEHPRLGGIERAN